MGTIDRWGRQFTPLELPPGEHSAWFRLMLLDKPAGPWRPTIEEATLDALELGHASRSRRYGRVFLTAPAWLAHVDLAEGRAIAI